MMFRRQKSPEIEAIEQAIAKANEDAAIEAATRKSLLRLALRKLGSSVENSTDDLIDLFSRIDDK